MMFPSYLRKAPAFENPDGTFYRECSPYAAAYVRASSGTRLQRYTDGTWGPWVDEPLENTICIAPFDSNKIL